MVFDDCAEKSTVFETWFEAIGIGWGSWCWIDCKIGCNIGSYIGLDGCCEVEWEIDCNTGCKFAPCELMLLKTMPLPFAKPPL